MSVLADGVEAGNKPEGIDLAAYLELCSTDNGCRIAYTHVNGDSADVFTLTITVRKRHKDRDFTQFDFVGTNEEFIEYVRKPVYDYNEFYDRIITMSDKADEYYTKKENKGYDKNRAYKLYKTSFERSKRDDGG